MLHLAFPYLCRPARTKPPAVTQIVVSTGAFVVWVFALGEPFSSLAFYRPVYGSLLLILYNIIIPLFNPSELNS